MFQPTIHTPQIDRLMDAIVAIESQEEAYRFFEDICTIAEVKSIAQRLEVAQLLSDGETYQVIRDQTGASSATISRVNRALSYGAQGYTRTLAKMKESEK